MSFVHTTNRPSLLNCYLCALKMKPEKRSANKDMLKIKSQRLKTPQILLPEIGFVWICSITTLFKND